VVVEGLSSPSVEGPQWSKPPSPSSPPSSTRHANNMLNLSTSRQQRVEVLTCESDRSSPDEVAGGGSPHESRKLPTITRPGTTILHPALAHVRLSPIVIVSYPSLKSDRDRCLQLTALQGEVAVADQAAHLAVADPNCRAPQPHALPHRCACNRLAAADLKRVMSGSPSLATRCRRAIETRLGGCRSASRVARNPLRYLGITRSERQDDYRPRLLRSCPGLPFRHEELIHQYGAWIVFALVFLESIGLPLPGEAIQRRDRVLTLGAFRECQGVVAKRDRRIGFVVNAIESVNAGAIAAQGRDGSTIDVEHDSSLVIALPPAGRDHFVRRLRREQGGNAMSGQGLSDGLF
jgi:hypothetical protein